MAAQVADEILGVLQVSGGRTCHGLGQVVHPTVLCGAPAFHDRSLGMLDVLWPDTPRVALCPDRAGDWIEPDDRAHPLGVRRGEHRVRSSAGQEAKQDRTLRTNRVEHDLGVRDRGLQVRRRDVAARQAGTATVVEDHARIRGDLPPQSPRARLDIDDRVDVPHPVKLHEHVNRALTQSPVGEVHAVTSDRIACIRDLHPPIFPRNARCGNREGSLVAVVSRRGD